MSNSVLTALAKRMGNLVSLGKMPGVAEISAVLGLVSLLASEYPIISSILKLRKASAAQRAAVFSDPESVVALEEQTWMLVQSLYSMSPRGTSSNLDPAALTAMITRLDRISGILAANPGQSLNDFKANLGTEGSLLDILLKDDDDEAILQPALGQPSPHEIKIVNGAGATTTL